MNWLKSLFNGRTFGAARSPEWSEFRNAHIKEKCEYCGKGFFLELHHIKPFNLFPELELDSENVITLCRLHHFHLGHFFNWRKYNPFISQWISDKNQHEKTS